VYKKYRTVERPSEVEGFCRVATIEEVRADRYALNPGRYIAGASTNDTEDTPFEERLPALIAQLRKDFDESRIVTSSLLTMLGTIEGQG
jgi:type I restriction enzyme M protein